MTKADGMKVKDMELLDYFAAHALASIYEQYYLRGGRDGDAQIRYAAASCYNLAEAMMKEREERKLI